MENSHVKRCFTSYVFMPRGEEILFPPTHVSPASKAVSITYEVNKIIVELKKMNGNYGKLYLQT